MRQLAPVCRRVGSYPFAARAGVNPLRLPRRVAGRHVAAGTYGLVGRTRSGRRVFDVVARVTRGRGSRLEARELQHRPACVAALDTAVVGAATGVGGSATARSASGRPVGLSARPAADHRRAPGSPLVRAVSLTDAPATLRPLLYALLALSIGLLAVAAAPQAVLPAGPTAALVARHRAYLAACGIWLLAVVAVVTTFA